MITMRVHCKQKKSLDITFCGSKQRKTNLDWHGEKMGELSLVLHLKVKCEYLLLNPLLFYQ